eukprot:CAMPEP_0114573798 /NCGR_PEP_ID=MMETSP0114-20121206/19057_1 /TAXON_ID=31324 /ORGANISM="Goniomonas sp, Strain m" /LENGTH=52 /DNA_ID=CAMNT_0001761179 /DNA_START=406 /DNA_END=561 /DNA_ORIENTATION=+
MTGRSSLALNMRQRVDVGYTVQLYNDPHQGQGCNVTNVSLLERRAAETLRSV